MIEPGKIAAGDSLAWSRSLKDYLASDGWVLHYALFNATAAYTIDSAADGDDHAISIPATTTAEWDAGRYDWSAYVTHPDGRKKSLFTGAIIITPDLTAGPYDGRSHARKMLDAIEAVVEGRATANDLDLVRGQFNDRVIEREPERLIEWREKYKVEVLAEEQAAGIGRGERLPRSIKVRFTR